MRRHRNRAAGIVPIAVAITCICAASQAVAQAGSVPELRVETGVDPDSVTVGQPFRSAVRITVPEGFSATFEEFVGNDSVEAAGPLRIVEEGEQIAVLYDLVAWYAGGVPVAFAPVRLSGPRGEVVVPALPLAMPVVASVLPAGDEAVAPRPVKPLFVPQVVRPFPWWWLLLGAVIVTAGGALLWWRSRRRPSPVEVADPRAWAFAELDTISVAAEAGAAAAEVYRRGSWVLREYLARVDRRLGRELTTEEMGRRARSIGIVPGIVRAIVGSLAAADRAKFEAGHPAAIDDAREFLAAIRTIAGEYPAPGAPGKGTSIADERAA